MCDVEFKLAYFSLFSSGGINDVRAYKKLSLAKTIENLPIGNYVGRDHAYAHTEHMLTPFVGSQKRLPANDAYNFTLVSSQIKIEMTFGLVTTKWRNLQESPHFALRSVPVVLMTITRLHNFVAHKRIEENLENIEVMYSLNERRFGIYSQ